MMKLYLIFLSLVILGFGIMEGAQAMPGLPNPIRCVGDTHRSAVDELQDMVQNISIVGPVENRFTYSDYAHGKNAEHRILSDDEMHTKFSGTVSIRCGNLEGSANVVKRNKCLALNSHIFLRKDRNGKCLGPMSSSDIEQCYVRAINVMGLESTEKYSINPKTLAIGDHCNHPEVLGNDWAVVELNQPAPVVPYDVFDASVLGNPADDYSKIDSLKITAVVAKNTLFAAGDVPSICDGIMETNVQTTSSGVKQYLQTISCSGGLGNSGGAVGVQRPGQPLSLIGIITVTKTKKHNYVPYGTENYTGGPLIEGDFAQAIKDCAARN